MINNFIEPGISTRTSPKWLHTLNLVWNGLTFMAFASLAVVTLRALPESGLNPYLGQVSNRGLFLWVYISGFFALMALIAFIDSLRRITGKKKTNRPGSWRWLKYSILLFPIALYLTWAWEASVILPHWIFAILVFLSISIPVVWISRMASGNMWGMHPGRDASMFSFSASVSVPFMVVIQGLVAVVLFELWIITDYSAFMAAVNSLNLEQMFQSPMLIFLLFCFLVVIVPIIEELFKTLAVWLLLGMDITPKGGYQSGLMSGAAFALMEGALYALQSASVVGNAWVFFILGRLGGTLIHISSGALIGWALATAWREKEPLKAVLAYLIAMVVHALWNLIVFSTQIAPIFLGTDTKDRLAIVMMGIVFLSVAVGFVLFARHVVHNRGEAVAHV